MRVRPRSSLAFVFGFCCLFPAEGSAPFLLGSASSPTPVLTLPQIHQPTKQGNVAQMHPEEPAEAIQPKVTVDPAQLQREARELLELSQSVQPDIEAMAHGLHPKDTIEKLKRIQKLAKHLRGELAP